MLSISVSEVVFTETIETADYWFGEMICGFVDKEGIQFIFWYGTPQTFFIPCPRDERWSRSF